jgi:hypothetical protein
MRFFAGSADTLPLGVLRKYRTVNMYSDLKVSDGRDSRQQKLFSFFGRAKKRAKKRQNGSINY